MIFPSKGRIRRRRGSMDNPLGNPLGKTFAFVIPKSAPFYAEVFDRTKTFLTTHDSPVLPRAAAFAETTDGFVVEVDQGPAGAPLDSVHDVLGADDVFGIALDVCLAMAIAWSFGVAHGNLRPACLVLDRITRRLVFIEGFFGAQYLPVPSMLDGDAVVLSRLLEALLRPFTADHVPAVEALARRDVMPAVQFLGRCLHGRNTLWRQLSGDLAVSTIRDASVDAEWTNFYLDGRSPLGAVVEMSERVSEVVLSRQKEIVAPLLRGCQGVGMGPTREALHFLFHAVAISNVFPDEAKYASALVHGYIVALALVVGGDFELPSAAFFHGLREAIGEKRSREKFATLFVCGFCAVPGSHRAMRGRGMSALEGLLQTHRRISRSIFISGLRFAIDQQHAQMFLSALWNMDEDELIALGNAVTGSIDTISPRDFSVLVSYADPTGPNADHVSVSTCEKTIGVPRKVFADKESVRNTLKWSMDISQNPRAWCASQSTKYTHL